MNKNDLYRMLPNVHVLLEEDRIQMLTAEYGRQAVKEAIGIELGKLRSFIEESCAAGGDDGSAVWRARQTEPGRREEETAAQKDRGEKGTDAAQSGWPERAAALAGQIAALPERIARTAEAMHRPQIRKVINGTGTILHTNLGRAPISREHMEYIASVITGYSNLEYDLEKGGRGERYSHFEELLCRLTGAEAAIAVNNNASSVLLILSALAKGGEAVVSRGELVEIGGKFRIPDVMEQSGAALVEVGTTNKTYLSDYEAAVSENTKLILKVHTSNYRIVGFTKSVDVGELAEFGRQRGIPVAEDLGSGLLIDFRKYMQTDLRDPMQEEPLVRESVRKGADLVCFSGDKLLGGPQAGIIVGKRKYIEKLKSHPLMRALRIDKFTVTALELILREYLWEEKAVQNVPVLRMITKSEEDVRKDAEKLAGMLRKSELDADISVQTCFSQIGGGSLPMERIPSAAVVIQPKNISAVRLEQRLRHVLVPVFGRVQNDAFWLDTRTIREEEFGTAVSSLLSALNCSF